MFDIGKRFALMQMKIALSLILKNFKVVPHETTPKTIKYDYKNVGTLIPVEPVLLNIEYYKSSQ